MSTTYSTNAELLMDDGKSIDSMLDVTLSRSKKTLQKDAARLRAYNKINDQYLQGRTVIPATHIASLKQVEIDLVISDIITGSFSGETGNVSEWAEKYSERAEEILKNVRFDATSEDAVADSQNTGDGTVGTISINNEFTMTEKWVFIAQNANLFSVRGTLTKMLFNAEVGESYPEKNWTETFMDYGMSMRSKKYEEYPISFTITAGSIDFVQYDRFTFKTYSASYYRQIIGDIIRG